MYLQTNCIQDTIYNSRHDIACTIELSCANIILVYQLPQNSLMHYLKELQVCSGRDRLIAMIPESIKLEHYVSLRLVLRR